MILNIDAGWHKETFLGFFLVVISIKSLLNLWISSFMYSFGMTGYYWTITAIVVQVFEDFLAVTSLSLGGALGCYGE